jgi:hypothetical protein
MLEEVNLGMTEAGFKAQLTGLSLLSYQHGTIFTKLCLTALYTFTLHTLHLHPCTPILHLHESTLSSLLSKPDSRH